MDREGTAIKGNKLKWIGGIALLGLGVWIGGAITTNASTPTQPGSADDPLVTKSYVDKLLAGGGGGSNNGGNVNVDQIKAELQDELAKAKQEIQKMLNQAGAGSGSGSAVVEIEVLKPGMKLFGGQGTTVIVRTGSDIRAISTDGDGIPDLTAGEDIQDGQKIALNHLLLFPREGTRGLMLGPDQKDDVYVFIQGSYLIAK